MQVGDLVTYQSKRNNHLCGMIGIVINRGEGKFQWLAEVFFPSYSPSPVQIRVDHLRKVKNENR